ncbi:MAG: hypothetical protein CL908_24195 [Deltaproteobacteria bacterium]|nr:hypothetical protein [Deltaproteobacteria bacterium]
MVTHPRSLPREISPSRHPLPIDLRGGWLAPLLLGMLALAPRLTTAQEVVSASPDIQIAIGVAGLATADEAVAADNQLGIVLLENLGSLPGSADVVAFGLDLGGDRLFVLDTTAALAGGVTASRGDVVRYDGASYSIEFDASAAGVPAGSVADAVSIAADGLLLSFDTTVALPGLTVADEDLVHWDGAVFSLALDGSAEGIDAAHDVDAAQDLGGGAFLVSLDTMGTVGGITAADEDVLRFDGSTWSLEFDASGADADWASADLDAIQVPEPGGVALLVAGSVFLSLAAQQRARRGTL